MRRLLIILILGMLGGNMDVYAQIHGYSPQVSVRAFAEVISNTSLITIRDVNLNETKIVDGLLSVSPISSPFAGLMRIDGTPNAQIRITYLTSETLIDENGSGGTIKARYRISGFGADNQFASTLLDVGEAIIRVGQSGQFFLWLGADLDLSMAQPGVYTSEFIIELEGN